MMKISCLVVVFIILVTSGNVFAVQVSMIICLRGLLRGIGELFNKSLEDTASFSAVQHTIETLKQLN
jgi:hypothetical protein